MDDGLASDDTPVPAAMDEDAMAGAEGDTSVDIKNRSSSTASTPPPSTITDSKQAELEVLQAENAFLRLALEETQAKLRAATNIGRSVRPVRSRSTSSVSSTSNPGVAYAQMRRLLLKDERFLRDTFLPFLNMDDFGRCAESIVLLRSAVEPCVEDHVRTAAVSSMYGRW